MAFGKISRRRWFRLMLAAAPGIAVADAFWLEPRWIRRRTVRLNSQPSGLRLLHFTDLHFKGDTARLEALVRLINDQRPDLVCFTGDIVEDAAYAEAVLAGFAGIRAPVYGVPGNHDYWSGIDFDRVAAAFAATGGAWLVDRTLELPRQQLALVGLDQEPEGEIDFRPGWRNIVLMHYPAYADLLPARAYELILAGHSHGGQVRLPGFGALVVPYQTGRYELGLYQTAAGPLYVGAGIGWFFLPVRFNCRPEITLFEL